MVEETAIAVVEKIGEISIAAVSAATNFLFEGVIELIPDIVGYTAIVAGGMVMFAPFVNRSPLTPLGFLSVVGIIGVSVLGGW